MNAGVQLSSFSLSQGAQPLCGTIHISGDSSQRNLETSLGCFHDNSKLDLLGEDELSCHAEPHIRAD